MDVISASLTDIQARLDTITVQLARLSDEFFRLEQARDYLRGLTGSVPDSPRSLAAAGPVARRGRRTAVKRNERTNERTNEQSARQRVERDGASLT